MVRIKRFNESISIMYGDFLLKLISTYDYVIFSESRGELLISDDDMLLLGNIFKGARDFIRYKSIPSDKLAGKKVSMFVTDHTEIGIFKYSDDWWILKDYSDVIRRQTDSYSYDGNLNHIYLCDGIDGLKLFNDLINGKNLESRDIIW